MRFLIGIWLIMAVLLAPGPVAAATVVDEFAVKDKVVAVTLENLEDPAAVGKILELGRTADVRFTLFTGARWLDEHRAVAARLVEQKHEFGNSGMMRIFWRDGSPDKLATDLKTAAGVIRSIAGRDPVFVRPPYNSFDARDRQIVDGYQANSMIARGLDTGDWMLSTPRAVLEMVLTQVKPGSVVNVNLLAKNAAAALPDIVSGLVGAGYKLVTLSELKEKAAATPEVKLISKTPAKPRTFSVLSRVETNRPFLAITFDDGGPAARAGEILDVLKANGIHCTFFLLGGWMAENPELVRRIIAEGHEIANHTYNHPRLTWLSEDEIATETTSTEEAVMAAAGKAPVKYFRPPYGSYNSSVVQTVQNLGYEAFVLWSIDTRDWSGRSAGAMTDLVLNHAGPGDIVLFHLHGVNTAEALRDILPGLREQGLTAVTLSELFNL